MDISAGSDRPDRAVGVGTAPGLAILAAPAIARLLYRLLGRAQR